MLAGWMTLDNPKQQLDYWPIWRWRSEWPL